MGMCAHLYKCACMFHSARTVQRITCRSWFSLSTVQIPEIELSSLGSVADSFIHLSHLPWGGDNNRKPLEATIGSRSGRMWFKRSGCVYVVFLLLFLKMFISNETCPVKGKDLGWGIVSSVFKKEKEKKKIHTGDNGSLPTFERVSCEKGMRPTGSAALSYICHYSGCEVNKDGQMQYMKGVLTPSASPG